MDAGRLRGQQAGAISCLPSPSLTVSLSSPCLRSPSDAFPRLLSQIIELITRKPGLFSLINDAGKAQGQTDDGLLETLHAAFGPKSTSHHKDKTYSQPKRPGVFVVHHYAGSVNYSIEGFIDKNKDELSISVKKIVEEHTQFEPLRELALAFRKRMEVQYRPLPSPSHAFPRLLTPSHA